MFIKLTRLDNTPIWINASFVVTVEPRKAGGAIVVPIGDGLDYDVKETPEAVLGMLGDAPAPAVVPVPPPPGLAPKTLGVAPDPAPAVPAETTAAAPAAEPAAAPVRRTSRTRTAKAKAADAAAEAATDDKPAAKKPRARRTKKAEEAPAETPPAVEAAALEPVALEQALPDLPLSEDELVRLRKLAPGTVRKLQNTLVAQFRTVAPEAAVAALEAHGILSLDRDHVTWR